jgi:hypothetical protein
MEIIECITAEDFNNKIKSNNPILIEALKQFLEKNSVVSINLKRTTFPI